MEEENKIKHEAIESLIRNGYKLKVGTYINMGFNIYRKYFWGFLGMSAIFGIIGYGLTFHTFSKPFTFQSPEEEFKIFTYVIVFINSIIMYILGTEYFFVAREIQNNHKPVFKDFFKWIKYWKQLLIASVIIYAIYMIFSSLPLKSLTSIFLNKMYYFLSLHDKTHSLPYKAHTLYVFKSGYLALFFFLTGIYLHVAITWTQQFIIFKGMGFYKAIITSLRIITKRWWNFLFLTISIYAILTAFMISVLILFFILSGIFHFSFISQMHNEQFHTHRNFQFLFIMIGICMPFIAPILYIPYYTAFEDIVGTESNEQLTMNNEQ
jgi:hypothetical protein